MQGGLFVAVVYLLRAAGPTMHGEALAEYGRCRVAMADKWMFSRKRRALWASQKVVGTFFVQRCGQLRDTVLEPIHLRGVRSGHSAGNGNGSSSCLLRGAKFSTKLLAFRAHPLRLTLRRTEAMGDVGALHAAKVSRIQPHVDHKFLARSP